MVDLSINFVGRIFDLNIFFNYSLGRHIVKIYDDMSLTVNGDAKPLFVDVNDVNIWTGGRFEG